MFALLHGGMSVVLWDQMCKRGLSGDPGRWLLGGCRGKLGRIQVAQPGCWEPCTQALLPLTAKAFFLSETAAARGDLARLPRVPAYGGVLLVSCVPQIPAASPQVKTSNAECSFQALFPSYK